MTYLLMSIPFIAVGIIVFLIGALHAHRRGRARRYFSSWAITTATLLILTAVFDNIMMMAGFFDYGTEEISGVRFGLMPVEDFLYPLAGALLLAGIWQLLGGDSEGRDPSDD